MADDLDDLRMKLRALGREREEARQRAAELSRDLEPLVRQAHAAGMSYREIAGLAGLSVPTVQAMVRGDRRW